MGGRPDHSPIRQGNRDQCFSVLLPPAQDQKVMVLGGGGPGLATNHTDVIDLKAGAPHYVPGPNLAHARGLHNCVFRRAVRRR
jgi:hypothetical protein